MTCQQVQTNLSLYLYGELDFEQEESLERHLDGCAFCQLALRREKEWHGAVNAQRVDVPLDLLSESRRDLSRAVRSSGGGAPAQSWWRRWLRGFSVAGTRWSAQLAAASFLVFVGFGAARLLDGTSGRVAWFSESGLLPTVHVRDIQPDGKDGVRLLVEQVSQQQITGRVEDGQIRRLLLAAVDDPSDAGIRVYSLEMLKGQHGGDVRDALLKSARRDPNSAVRLKALEGLRQLSPDASSVETLKYVLEHDDNPGVRSEAIDVLVTSSGRTPQLTPSLAGTLEEIMHSARGDEYVHARCVQMLREMDAPIDVY